MPGRDQTGPLGQGPKTGRGLGDCTGPAVPGDANTNPAPGLGRGRGPGRGAGRGSGRGAGQGFGRGRGRGRGRGN